MKIELFCNLCNQTHKYGKKRLKHYAHDLDGDNVYVECKSCTQPISCSKQAINSGCIILVD